MGLVLMAYEKAWVYGAGLKKAQGYGLGK